MPSLLVVGVRIGISFVGVTERNVDIVETGAIDTSVKSGTGVAGTIRTVVRLGELVRNGLRKVGIEAERSCPLDFVSWIDGHSRPVQGICHGQDSIGCL